MSSLLYPSDEFDIPHSQSSRHLTPFPFSNCTLLELPCSSSSSSEDDDGLNETRRMLKVQELTQRKTLVKDDAELATCPSSLTDEEPTQVEVQLVNSDNVYSNWWGYQDKRRRNKLAGIIGVALLITLVIAITAGVLLQSKPPEGKIAASGDDGNSSAPEPDPFVDISWAPLLPLSNTSPQDLGFPEIERPIESRPPEVLQRFKGPKPTNAWYQSLLLSDTDPSDLQRTYTMPYVLDVVGPIPGLRIMVPRVVANSDLVQAYVDEAYGLTLGSAFWRNSSVPLTHRYWVETANALGVTLGFRSTGMYSTIVKGMPYVTMRYEASTNSSSNNSSSSIVPTIASPLALGQDPIVDGYTTLSCSDVASPQWVRKEIQLYFAQNDFTWIVFVSDAVQMICVRDGDGMTLLQVVENTQPLTIRVALVNPCTSAATATGLYCDDELLPVNATFIGQPGYLDILRKHASIVPGPNAAVQYKTTDNQVQLGFDWDPHKYLSNDSDTGDDLVMFAMRHHWDMLPSSATRSLGQRYCFPSLKGAVCLVKGASWTLTHPQLQISFRAAQPAAWAVSALADSLHTDLQYRLTSLYENGGGDTYFSGKRLAKIGRILIIAEEVIEMCEAALQGQSQFTDYISACSGVPNLNLDNLLATGVSYLKNVLDVWLNSTVAVTPFVWDSSWGGVISCGCTWNGFDCSNRYPSCPALLDKGLNFGNAFYSDMHFHYGYFIYACAVISHFDSSWAAQNYERVLILIRSIANPSTNDEYFTPWRNKDWFDGHSWAQGIGTPPNRNGKDQESSSEAIAAYESVALYGLVMSQVYASNTSAPDYQSAQRVRDAGLALTSSELRSAQFYYHVGSEDRIYGSTYTHPVVGILWQSMIQFQTWFGSSPYFMFGIQLLPLTPIVSYRDNSEWAKSVYSAYYSSCSSDSSCLNSGWSVLMEGLLAAVGQPTVALLRLLQMSQQNFQDSAGDGHSLSNTIWFVATRPSIASPWNASQMSGSSQSQAVAYETLTNCYRDTCTSSVLDAVSNGYTCRARIQWLMSEQGLTERAACTQVASVEFSQVCGPCTP